MADDRRDCEHPACSCLVGDDEEYCSAYCSGAGDTLGIGCECGHRGCAGEINATDRRGYRGRRGDYDPQYYADRPAGRRQARDYDETYDRGYGAYARDYEGRGYGRDYEYDRRPYAADYRDDRRARGYGERGWGERAGDEVRSWFGDDDAERRRRADERREGGYERRRYGLTGGAVAGGYRDYDDDRRYSYRDRRDYGERYGRGYYGERGAWDKTTDEVRSWFGDDGAERRRRADERREEWGEGRRAERYRGRGPRNYRRSDERVREDISERLSDDYRLDASDIEVSVAGGEVTLEGTVASRGAKRRAEDLAEAVSGVTHVQNNLRVSRPADEEGVLRRGVDRLLDDTDDVRVASARSGRG